MGALIAAYPITSMIVATVAATGIGYALSQANKPNVKFPEPPAVPNMPTPPALPGTKTPEDRANLDKQRALARSTGGNPNVLTSPLGISGSGTSKSASLLGL